MTGGMARVIETAMGPTFVRAVGTGPTVFVVHGGPGFDHRYLVAALHGLARRRTLVFFDQPGCGQTPEGDELTAAFTFRHFGALARALAPAGPFGLIAHSWGALVAIAAAKESGLSFDEGLLITPVPLTDRDYSVCRDNLLSRVPAEKLAEFGRLAGLGAGGEIIRLLLPYYLAPSSPAKIPDLHIAMSTFAAVNASMGSFDYTADIASVARLHVVLTEFDFTTRQLVRPLADAVARTEVMSSVGHFPFAEDPKSFAAIMDAAFPD
jgi:pimeloyl-ACP methyl ester carboxylesterase